MIDYDVRLSTETAPIRPIKKLFLCQENKKSQVLFLNEFSITGSQLSKLGAGHLIPGGGGVCFFVKK